MSELSIREMAEQGRKNSSRAVSYMEISNLFTEHVHYVRANMEAEDFETLWAGRDDICYMVGETGFAGREAVKGYFVTARETRRTSMLPILAKYFEADGVKENEDYLGYGDHEFHSLVNPFIQVAGDNQTAKAVWWSPGIVGAYDEECNYRIYFTAIIYLADFLHETDGWKIWHLREFEEFSFDTKTMRLSLPGTMGGPGGAPGSGEPGGHGPGPMLNDKATVEEAVATGKKIGGRTGENIRTLYGLPPASPPMHKNPEGFVDAGQLNTINGVCKLYTDVIKPYETWDDSIGCMRSYLKYFPAYDREIENSK